MASTTLRVFHARLALDDAFAQNHAGAHGAATSPWNSRAAPTLAQRVAGNYAMGDAAWQGLRIRVENPAGTTREGIDPDGTPWRNLLAADYGYFAGTTGADGDGVDVFLGPYPECRSAWLINQTQADGSFDEVKALVGFVDRSHALDAYRMSYSTGWSQFRPPIEVSAQQLRWWLTKGDTSRPFSLDLVPSEPEMTDTTINAPALPRIFWDSAAMPAAGRTLADLLYELRRHDGQDGLLLDAVTMADIREGAEVVVMDALVVQAGRLQPKMEALQRIMEAASDTVRPVALQFSDPLRRFGGVHVAVIWELSDGQTITAWFHNPDMTPAKFTPADDLVSWKWQLNKKDVTIVVAPESGRDLNTREVARRLMRLAEKNSAAFQRANAKRADAVAEIDGLKATLAQKQGELKSLLGQIEVAKVAKADRDAAEAAARSAAEAAAQAVADAEAAIMARMRELGWSDSQYPGVLVRSWPALGPIGTMVTPDGERNLYASIKSSSLVVKLGDETVLAVPINGRLTDIADYVNGRILEWVAEKQAKNRDAHENPPIPQRIRSQLDLILQPVAQLAAALEGARETDTKFNGGGRYAAEVWQNLGGDARLATEAEKIAETLAKIPEGPNRKVAAAYFEDNRARPALTEQERGYFAADAEAARKASDPAAADGAIRYNPATDKYTPAIELGDVLSDGRDTYTVTRRSGFTLEVDIMGAGGARAASTSLSVDPFSPEFKGNLFKGMAASNPAKTPSEIVDAAHQFASATDAFKAWLAKSVDEPSYSPFASARDIDKAASAAGLRVEWDLYGGTAKMDGVTLDRADPVDVNVFQPGDKVVTQDGKDFTVLRQDGWQVSLKGKAGAVHANHLKLASGAKPKRVAMDGCGDDGDEDDFDPEAEFESLSEELDEGFVQGALDAAREYLPKGLVTDSASGVGAAVTELRIALQVVENNEPINRRTGNIAQADMEARNAAQFRAAIAMLESEQLCAA